MMQTRALPPYHVLTVLEKHTHLRPVVAQGESMLLTAVYGIFEAIVRTKNQIVARLLINKIDEIASRVGTEYSRELAWLREGVALATTAQVLVQDTVKIIRTKDFNYFLDMLKAELMHSRSKQEAHVMESRPVLQPDEIIALSRISALFNTELCIYQLLSDEHYERTEIFIDKPGLIVDMYQLQSDTATESGLVYHDDVMKVDLSQTTPQRRYPFVCQPAKDIMAVVRCSKDEYTPRMSNLDKTVGQLGEQYASRVALMLKIGEIWPDYALCGRTNGPPLLYGERSQRGSSGQMQEEAKMPRAEWGQFEGKRGDGLRCASEQSTAQSTGVSSETTSQVPPSSQPQYKPPPPMLPPRSQAAERPSMLPPQSTVRQSPPMLPPRSVLRLHQTGHELSQSQPPPRVPQYSACVPPSAQFPNAPVQFSSWTTPPSDRPQHSPNASAWLPPPLPLQPPSQPFPMPSPYSQWSQAQSAPFNPFISSQPVHPQSPLNASPWQVHQGANLVSGGSPLPHWP
jgi:hypothetical protein